MKRISKKIAGLLLALIVTAGMIPSLGTDVRADEPAEQAPKTYPVWVGGVSVTEENKNDILGDKGTAKYDPASGVLTLNKPAIKGKHSDTGAQIYAEGKDLTIAGSAALELKDSKYGVYVKDASLTINGDLTAKADAKDSIGIYAKKDITFKSGTISAKGEKNGIAADGKIKVENDVKSVTAEGKTAPVAAAKDALTIADKLEKQDSADGKVVIKAKEDTAAKAESIEEASEEKKPMMAPDDLNLTIVADPEEGGEVIVSKEAADPESETGTKCTATAEANEGYHFKEWKIEPADITFSATDNTCEFTVNEKDIPDVTVTGVFEKDNEEPATHTVTVSADPEAGGTASASPESGAKDTEVTLTNTPAEGYTFKEWQVVKGGVTIADDKFKIGDEDVEIKAVFEKEPEPETHAVKVTADPEAGGTVSAKPESGVKDTEVTLTQTAKDGYKFKEWQVVKGGVTVADDKFKIGDEDVEIKAVFEKETPTPTPTPKPKKYTVTFNTNGGSKVNAQTVESGKTATKPKDPTRTGYAFAGWYSDSKLTKAFNFKTPITANTTVYAKWTQTTFTITFNLNGGKLNGKTGTVKVTAKKGTKITLPRPTRTGYTFNYWEGSKYNAGASYTVTGDHTFKAQWKKNSSSTTKKTTTTPKKTNTTNRVANSPRTGDTSHVILWAVVAAAALAGLIFALSRRKRA